jgi:hypothetical protein
MAGIKDKLVSVESLSEVHQHNKDTYMTKVNPIVSGTITFDGDVATSNGFNISAKNDSFEISNKDINNENKETKLIIGDTNVFAYAEGERIEQDETGASATKNVDSSISVIPNHIYLSSINDTDSIHSSVKISDSKVSIDSNDIELNGDAWFKNNIYIGGTSKDDAIIKGFIIHNSTTSLPTVTNGAILIAYDIEE